MIVITVTNAYDSIDIILLFFICLNLSFNPTVYFVFVPWNSAIITVLTNINLSALNQMMVPFIVSHIQGKVAITIGDHSIAVF